MVNGFYNDIVKATRRVMKKRGWSSNSGTDLYSPYYFWGNDNHKEWNKEIHHVHQHPHMGLIIWRGFFYNRFAENTKDINKELLKHVWEKDLQKYDQFIIEILREAFLKVMIKHGEKRMTISFSSESYKNVDLNKNTLKKYIIFNNTPTK